MNDIVYLLFAIFLQIEVWCHLHTISGSESCCLIRYVYRGWEKAAESAGQRWNMQECRVQPRKQRGSLGNCCNLVLLSVTQSEQWCAQGLVLGDTSAMLTVGPPQVETSGSGPSS